MASCVPIGWPAATRVYDCRHAAATTWLRAGMPLGETARRLGHSVETLVSTYVGALDDEEHTANQRIDTYLDAGAPTSGIVRRPRCPRRQKARRGTCCASNVAKWAILNA